MQDTLKKTLIRQWRKSEKQPKLVIDTNLIVSGLFSPKGLPSKLIERLAKRHFQLCVTRPIFKEYEAVVNRFTKISKTKRSKLIGKIRQHVFWFTSSQRINAIKDDPTDNKFLECALASNADFIVSGDKHLLNLKNRKFKNTYIVRLSELNEILHWR